MSDTSPLSSPHYDPSQRAIVLRSGSILTLEAMIEALSIGDEGLRTALKDIVASGSGEHLKLFVQALEIQEKKSVFTEGNAQIGILEETAREFPLSYWLESMAVAPTQTTRRHIGSWWETFMTMAREKGFAVSGAIDEVGRAANLWTATGALAEKMRRSPATYRFMPVLLINHPQQVGRLLDDLTEAEPFIEVMVGERMEDMRQGPEFLGAFSTAVDSAGKIIRDIPHVIWSVELALKRG